MHDRTSSEIRQITDISNYIIHTTQEFQFPKDITFSKLHGTYYFIHDASKAQINSIQSNSNVISVEKASQIRFDTRFEAGFMENGNLDLTYKNGYLWSLRSTNLTGKGEIIALADSGIDYRHPMLNDSSRQLINNTLDLNQRKIVYYDSWKDFYDYIPGHGTHTAGIIAGKSECGNILPLYDGIAPESKLYFLDMAKGDNKMLFDDFDKDKFVQSLKDLNIGISSNSWGSNEIDYTSTMTDIYDNLAYNNPDILFVFAAGNSEKSWTIDSPSSGKNIFCVGATDGTPGQMMGEASTPQIEISGTKIDLLQSSWSTNLFNQLNKEEPLFNVAKPVYVTSNDNTCDSIKQILENEQTKILILKSLPDCNKMSKTVLATLSDDDFQLISQSSSANFTMKLSDFSYEKANFASAGPAYSGILKPDISAPGVITGALSYGNSETAERKCDFSSLSQFTGTSESTPIISGFSSLLREHFRSKGVTPSSSLLKSLIISSTKSNKRDLNTGFGIPRLDCAIKSSYSDRVLIKGNQHLYCEFSSQTGDISASISWLDPLLSRDIAYPLLADLSIFIESPTGKVYQEEFGNSILTTNKKISVTSETYEGTWKLHVISSRFEGNVSFSCSISNYMSEKLEFAEETEKCLSDCSCNKGICECPSDKTDHLCSTNSRDISNSGAFVGQGKYVFRARVPNIDKPRIDVSFKGYSNVYLIKGISNQPSDSFTSLLFRNKETNLSNYEVLEPGTNITIIVRSFSSGSFRISFISSSYIPSTPPPTEFVYPTSTPEIPPIRTPFPSKFESPSNTYHNSNITSNQNTKWILPTSITICSLIGIIMIVFIIFVVFKLRKSHKHEDFSTSGQLSAPIL
ncbi:Clan SB, family S8, subtilisin-like serine peptidase [Trichomonas vaginalis G3]|uniref:Clan SB, family S8, subtilisin-like serine peptidase n=1 Tax=Trichomonas vaginalis (strain ATCC PRA-98 / G3) TaxID=412133 RepID=A2FA02_TRIV3|nr:Clan SB, family S8, subtilisin-like serine peptidase [Trichomonas vaginalis G3]EAX98269.1 Clan SB, family S8, subtilisin-like serine peptidase [Trichomonas vaginalis G3]KAI5511195.1 Clan SB, family S8, subtilisin-like serine peptidase [Trichomonas vaginalis G3]|eukprot:XP_001311199.1 Clan SB, family S8, subtilisin-like serine peptidase [Trichomonas vaginalis G3]